MNSNKKKKRKKSKKKRKKGKENSKSLKNLDMKLSYLKKRNLKKLGSKGGKLMRQVISSRYSSRFTQIPTIIVLWEMTAGATKTTPLIRIVSRSL